MILHPCIETIAKRYAGLDEQIRKGTLDLPGAVGKYAWVQKDNTLGMAELNAADTAGGNDADHSIPFCISRQIEDRDGDVCVSRGVQLEEYALNPVVCFGHDTARMPIGKSVSPDGKLTVFPLDDRINAIVYFDPMSEEAMAIESQIRRKFLSACSISFVPIHAVRREREEEKGVYNRASPHRDSQMPPGFLYKAFSLTEWSCVVVPSCPAAVAIRDMLDKEKSFLTPRLQKALLPYAAEPKGKGFSGWCPSGPCPPCEMKEAEPVEKGSNNPSIPETGVSGAATGGHYYTYSATLSNKLAELVRGYKPGTPIPRGVLTDQRIQSRYNLGIRPEDAAAEIFNDLVKPQLDRPNTTRGPLFVPRYNPSGKAAKEPAMPKSCSCSPRKACGCGKGLRSKLKTRKQYSEVDEVGKYRIVYRHADGKYYANREMELNDDSHVGGPFQTEQQAWEWCLAHKSAKSLAKADGPKPDEVHHLPSRAEAERTLRELQPWWPGWKFMIGTDADGWFVKPTNPPPGKAMGKVKNGMISAQKYVPMPEGAKVRVISGGYVGVYTQNDRGNWVQEGRPNSMPLPDDTIQRWIEQGKAEIVKAAKQLLESSGPAGGYTAAVQQGTATSAAGDIACVACGGAGACPGCEGVGTVSGVVCEACGGDGNCSGCSGVGVTAKSVAKAAGTVRTWLVRSGYASNEGDAKDQFRFYEVLINGKPAASVDQIIGNDDTVTIDGKKVKGSNMAARKIAAKKTPAKKGLKSPVKKDRVMGDRGNYRVLQFHDGYGTMYKIVDLKTGKVVDETEELSTAMGIAANMAKLKGRKTKDAEPAPEEDKDLTDEGNPDGTSPMTDEGNPAELKDDDEAIDKGIDDPNAEPFTPKPSALEAAKAFRHMKDLAEYFGEGGEGDLAKMDHPGMSEALKDFLADEGPLAKAMSHVKDALHAHHGDGDDPDELMEKHCKALDGGDEFQPGEAGMVANGDVPPEVEAADEVVADESVDEVVEEAEGSDPDTEEILERYQRPKTIGGKRVVKNGKPVMEWANRTVGVARRAKDGRVYIVRNQSVRKAATVEQVQQALAKRGIDAKVKQTSEGIAVYAPGQLQAIHNALRADGFEGVTGYTDRVVVTRSSPDGISKDLTDSGNPAELAPGPAAPGDGAIIKDEAYAGYAASMHKQGIEPQPYSKWKDADETVEDKDLTDEGNPAELKDADEPVEEKDAETEPEPEAKGKSKKTLSPHVSRALADLQRTMRQNGFMPSGAN